MACPDVSPPPDAFTKFTGPSRGVPAPLYVLVSRQAYSVVVSFVRADLPHSAPSSYLCPRTLPELGQWRWLQSMQTSFGRFSSYACVCHSGDCPTQIGGVHGSSAVWNRRPREMFAFLVRDGRPPVTVFFRRRCFARGNCCQLGTALHCWGPSFIYVLGSGTVKTPPIFSALSLFIILSVCLPLLPLFFFFVCLLDFFFFFLLQDLFLSDYNPWPPRSDCQYLLIK